MRSLLVGLMCLIGLTLPTQAQPQYPAYPYGQAPMTPQSWSYDPYASGLGPCPQRRDGDVPCNWSFFPTYGQPSYWPTR
jgi:hypothetical protein